MALAASRLLHQLRMNSVTVKTSAGDVAMVNEGVVLVNKATGAATQVTLTPNPHLTTFVFVKDMKGDAGINPITVVGDSGDTIDGATSYVIRTDGGACWFGWNGTEWNALPVATYGAVGLWKGSPNPFQLGQRKFNYLHVNPATFGISATDLLGFSSIDDAGTGTNAYADIAGGTYNVLTAAADNDYHAMATLAETWLFAAGKKLWFEAEFKLAEATTNESAWWFGLTDTLTTGGLQANAAGPLASYDGALIWKDEATMLIDFETSNAGTQATTTNMATFVTDTWTRVGFHFDGTATTSVVTPYFDVSASGIMTAGTPQNITLAGLEEMHLVFGVKAGPTAAAETLQLRDLKCLQLI